MSYNVSYRRKPTAPSNPSPSAAHPAPVPQSQPLDERQVPNRAGGWTYEVEPLQMFRRWLVLGPGAGKGTYYASEQELVLEADSLILSLITNGDGIKLVDELVALRPRVPKAGPSIFALALLASFGDVATKRYIAEKIKAVLWTGTDMFTFFSYVNSMRGWGRAIERMANAWYDRSPLKLAQTMTKYRSREGWRHRDVLLKGSVRPNGPEAAMVFRYIVSRDKGRTEQVAESLLEIMGSDSPAAKYLLAIEACWAVAREGALDSALTFVVDHQLPREVLPTELLKYDRTWEALLPHMGGVALVRNMGKLGSLGLLAPGHPVGREVCRRLEDPAWIAEQKLHPAHLITAWSVYRQGHGDKGSLRWEVSPNVLGALETGFYLSFGNVEPIGETVISGLDVSGSMGWTNCAGTSTLTAREAAAVMMMVRKRVEPSGSHYSMAFAGQFVPLRVQKNWSLEQVIAEMSGLPFGSTDCALPMQWAIQNKIRGVKLFEVYTDSETWFGSEHPIAALERYNQTMGENARLAVVQFAMSRNTIADPRKPYTLDVVGFDTASPRLVSEFARGEL